MSALFEGSSAGIAIRFAAKGDEHLLFSLVQALARFERLEHAVTGSPEALAQHLFGERPAAEALIAESAEGPLGFALFFPTYSTFLTRPGLYLEDLFVLQEHRGRGVGRALIDAVRTIAEQRGAGRLEWAVLDWNERAIGFYRSMGATILPDWRLCRIDLSKEQR